MSIASDRTHALRQRFGANIRKRWVVTSCNGSSLPLADIFLFWLSLSGFPQGFKMRLLVKGFYTLITDVSFSFPTNVAYHHPHPFRAQRPRWHSFLSPIDVGPPPNLPLLFPASLLAHRLVSTHLQGTISLRRMREDEHFVIYLMRLTLSIEYYDNVCLYAMI